MTEVLLAAESAEGLGETRSRIIEVSTLLFADSGYAAVSVRDIVEEVGITPGAIYHHFASKKDLYRIAVERAFAAVTRNLVQDADTKQQPEQRLRAVLHRFANYIFARSPELRLVDRVIFEAGAGRVDIPAMINGPREALAGLIEQISGDAPARELAEHLIAATYGAAKLRPVRTALEGGDWFSDPDTLADSLSELILTYLGRRG